MKIMDEKIVKKLNDSLKAIRSECSKHTKCDNCVLRNSRGDQCSLDGTIPQEWKLVCDNINRPRRLFE